MQSASRFTTLSALALGIAGALAFGQADASGFQLRESSVKNLGRANAGSAVSNGDASVVALNPAAMAGLDRNTVQVDLTAIDLDADFTGGGQHLAGTPLASSIQGGNGGDPGDVTLVPAFAAVFPMGDSGLTFGASVGAPFGLKTEYEDGWVGRYQALTSDVKVVDLTLSVSLESQDGYSIGAGLIYERAEAELSKALDFGTALCAGSGNPLNCVTPGFPFRPGQYDGDINVSGDSTEFGFILGAQVRPSDNLAIGLSHRTEIKHRLDGTVDFDTRGNPLLAAGFPDGPGGAQVTLPSITTLSLRYGVTDNVRVLADFQQTGWDSLDTLEIRRANGALVGSEEFDWDETHFFSVGAEFDMSDAFTLRAGVAQDESPTNDAHRSPRLPDDDRMLYSIGASWNVSDNLTVDAAYQHITIDDPTVNNVSDTGSTLSGSFDGSANLFGISAQYRF